MSAQTLSVLLVLAAFASACELPPSSPENVSCWTAAGEAARSQGRWEDAREAFEHAAAAMTPKDPTYARSMSELGGAYRALGRPRDAETAYRKALGALDASRAAEIPALQINLGQALAQQGSWQPARDLYQQAIAARERDAQPGDPVLSAALTDLALLYESRRDYSRAEKLLARARSLDEMAFTADSLRLARDWNNAASLEAARKRFPEAERMLRRSLDILERSLPPEHPERAQVVANLADVLYAEKRFAEAEILFKSSLDVLERAWGPLNPALAAWMEHYAAALHWSEDYAAAEQVRLDVTRIRVENTLRPK